jgi:hypothetical protein
MYPRFKAKQIINQLELNDYYKRCNFLSILQIMGMISGCLQLYGNSIGLIKIGPSKNFRKNSCIIDDSTHSFYDMIRIIYKALSFVKPGGMIIIEDIQKLYDESWFYNELKPILNEFQTMFFVDLEHDRRNSGMIENDKVLVLIKNGPPIFNYSLL